MTMSDTTAYFDRTAEQFSANYRGAPEFEERLAVWRAMIDAVLNERVSDHPCLDLGCGDGTLSLLVAARGVRTVGFDQSPAMLALARSHAVEQGVSERVEFIRASLPLAPDVERACVDTAGLIVCSSVLEYLDDPDGALRQCARLLKPGGTLLLSVPNWGSVYRNCESMVQQLVPARDSYVRYQRNQCRPDDIARVLGRAGVRVVQEQRFALPFQRLSGPIFGGYRGRWLATMVLLRAQREADI